MCSNYGKLLIIRGIPGSGKTMFAHMLANTHPKHCEIIEADMFRQPTPSYKYMWSPETDKYAHEWCRLETMRFLQQGIDVIVSNTFIRLWEITKFCDFLKISPNIVYRITTQYQNTHNVPDNIVKRMQNNIQDYIGEIIVDKNYIKN